MPSAEFERSLTVGRSPAECWGVLTDVGAVAGWVTVVGEVHELAHLDRYQAVLADQFGPFKLKADLDITVTDLDEGASISFRAKGEDRAVSTSIVVDGTLSLRPEDAGTTIHVKGRWNVIGTVATMGSGTIRKKADTIMEEFFTAASAELNQ
jgi:carbon monoxide dehydrogenase subunit G